MDIMSNIQALGSSISFRELLRKFRQEQTSSSFMSWFSDPTEEFSTSTSPSSFWWECNPEKGESTIGERFTSSPFPMGECETYSDEFDNASSCPYWLGCEDQEDQDNASISSSFSHDELSSDNASISSASSAYSDGDDGDELKEKYLPALGWWKIYRSGWWEHSEGASTYFDETYVEYRYSALLPPIPENETMHPLITHGPNMYPYSHPGC